ncbi:MAG: hypothetical protein ACOCQR_00910 [bacterium]
MAVVKKCQEKYTDYICDSCNSMVEGDEHICPVCGENLDWSEIMAGEA